MKTPAQTFPILEVVATIFASAEHQRKLSNKFDPTIDPSDFKPSERLFMPNGSALTYLPSLTSYTKMTLGMDSKWLDENTEVVTVMDRHYKDAEAAMDTIKNKVMLMVLKGLSINGFIGNLIKLIESETVLGRDVGLLTYIPRTAKQYAATDKIDEKKTSFMNSQAVGKVAEKVSVTVTIFNVRPMKEYGSILYECNDSNGNLVTFFKNEASKGQFDLDKTYNIKGRIKDVGTTQYSFGAIVNTLNYVEIVA